MQPKRWGECSLGNILKFNIFTPSLLQSVRNQKYFNLSKRCFIPGAFDIYMHFEWKMMLGEYICILKSQSAGKGVSHLKNLYQSISQIHKKGFSRDFNTQNAFA